MLRTNKLSLNKQDLLQLLVLVASAPWSPWGGVEKMTPCLELRTFRQPPPGMALC